MVIKLVTEFIESLDRDQPPAGVPSLLQALWWEAKGDWDKAHKIAQENGSSDAAWVHAYLHRKEGDEWNAGYWYSRAGKSKSSDSFEKEWEQIVNAFL